NHWGDLAGQCYSRIVKDYPLSNLVAEAKTRLTSMGMPVPKPDPEALARMQNQQGYEKAHHANPLLAVPMGMIRSSPDVHEAAQLGPPDLNPPDDTISATEVLNEGAAGPKFNIAASIERTGANPQASDTESVETSDAPNASANAQAADQPAAAPAVPSSAAAPSTMTSL